MATTIDITGPDFWVPSSHVYTWTGSRWEVAVSGPISGSEALIATSGVTDLQGLVSEFIVYGEIDSPIDLGVETIGPGPDPLFFSAVSVATNKYSIYFGELGVAPADILRLYPALQGTFYGTFFVGKIEAVIEVLNTFWTSNNLTIERGI